ncbi:MAG: InlB B-repeat-containing protein [Lysinibacillus sp.]
MTKVCSLAIIATLLTQTFFSSSLAFAKTPENTATQTEQTASTDTYVEALNACTTGKVTCTEVGEHISITKVADEKAKEPLHIPATHKGKSVTTIGEKAFELSRATAIYFEDSSKIESIGKYAFNGAWATNAIALLNIKTVPTFALANTEFSEIHLDGEKIKSIEGYAFSNSRATNAIALPNIEIVPNTAFQGVYFSEILLNGAEIKSIGSYAFNHAKTKGAIAFPIITTVPARAFAASQFSNIELNFKKITAYGEESFKDAVDQLAGNILINSGATVATSAFSMSEPYKYNVAFEDENNVRIDPNAFQQSNNENVNFKVTNPTSTAYKYALANGHSIDKLLVTFQSNDGSTISPQLITQGETVQEPTSPIRNGYMFDGWYKEDSFATPWDFNTDVVPEDMTLYARWVIPYVVTFDTTDGSPITTKKVKPNEIVQEPTRPTRNGYTFGGWYTEDSFATAWKFDTDVVPGDLTLYARWDAIPYEVTFNTAGGSPIAPLSVLYNEPVSEPTRPTRNGYTFGGWYTEDSFATAWKFATDKVPGDMTLYAKWNGIPVVTPPTPPISNESDLTLQTTSGEGISVPLPVKLTQVNGRTVLTGEITASVVVQLLEKLKDSDSRTWIIQVPFTENNIDEANFTMSPAIAQQLADAQLNVRFQANGQMVELLATSLNKISESLRIQLVPEKDAVRNAALLQRALLQEPLKSLVGNAPAKMKSIAQPLTVRTNLQNRPVLLTFEAPKDSNVANHVLYIEHSDGTFEVLRGQVNGRQITFEVNHFSTFALLTVDGADEFYNPTEVVTHQPYIQGYEDGAFKPNNAVTRLQMAAMLARELTGNNVPEASKLSFTDTANVWAKNDIEVVRSLGIMNGTTDTTFNPTGKMTRMQMAAIVVRWLDKQCEKTPDLQACTVKEQPRDYADVSPELWGYDDIQKVTKLGIMTGDVKDGNYYFNPKGNLTRAQAVKVLNRLFDRLPETNEAQQVFKDVTAKHWAYEEIQEAATQHTHD